MKYDKSRSEDEILEFLEEALEHEEYPNEESSYFVEFREYQRSTRIVFLWVSSLFTEEERYFIRDYLHEHLDSKLVVSIIRSDHHFDFNNEYNHDY